MTEPTEFELLELATPYALHAVTEDERADIEHRVNAAPQAVARPALDVHFDGKTVAALAMK